MTATQTAARTARAGLEKTLDGVARFGALQIRAWEWAAPRSGRPFVGAGRAIASMWTLAVPRYDTPAVSQYQAQGRAARGCIGLFLVLLVVPVLALVAAAYIAAQVDSVGGPLAVWAAVAGVVVLLGWYGAPRAGTGPAASTIEQDRIAEALAGRLSSVTEDKLRVSKPRREWTETGSSGRSFTVDLPVWVEAGQVVPHRAVIAAALGTKTDRITVTEGRVPNQAVVFVADKSPSELSAVWPLTDAHDFDLTRPIPIGVAPDGKPATLQLFSRDNRGALQGHHVLLAGMTGYGKSTLLQLILSAAALDPRAVLNLAVLKDTDDFEDIAPALSYLAVDASREELKVMLSRAVAHMATRAGVPYVVVIDEAQNALGEKGDREAREMVRLLLSSGRSAGIAVILVTQEPTKENLVPDLARRPQNRISFWQSQNETAERAMGAGMTDDTNPAKFGADDKGLAAVIGTNGLRGRVKTPMLAPELVARIAKDHAREPVEPVEFPSYALDVDDQIQDPEPAVPDPTDTIAHHVEAAWDEHLAKTDRVSPDHLAVILAASDPRYFGATGDSIRAELKAAGVEAEPLKGLIPGEPRRSSRGYRRAAVQGALGGVTQ